MHDISTFLMFSGEHYGKAKEAVDFYVSLFPESSIQKIDFNEPGENNLAGSVRLAEFCLNGKKYMAIDSLGPHEFNFTPSISLFVECETELEIRTFFEKLSTGGGVLMPLENYGFSPLFGWVNDRFGVSWQVNQLS